MENVQERTVRYINEAWSVEQSMVESLELSLKDIGSPAIGDYLKSAIASFRIDSDRLVAQLATMHEEPRKVASFFYMLVTRLGEMFHDNHDEYDATTQALIKLYTLANLKMAMYQSLVCFTEGGGQDAACALATELVKQSTDRREEVWPMISATARLALQAVR